MKLKQIKIYIYTQNVHDLLLLNIKSSQVTSKSFQFLMSDLVSKSPGSYIYKFSKS